MFPEIDARRNLTLRLSPKKRREEKAQKLLDHLSEKGYEHHGLVHELIAIEDAMKIRDAKAAVDKECETHLLAWELQETKYQVANVVQQVKQADLFISHPSWTCAIYNTPSSRRFFIKGQWEESCSGWTSSTTTVGTAASLDTISRLPGTATQAAVSADTQVHKSEAPRPPGRWPNWDEIVEPVVKPERRYGHPLAGLLWERRLGKVLLKDTWEKLCGRHQDGRKEKNMWDQFGKFSEKKSTWNIRHFC